VSGLREGDRRESWRTAHQIGELGKSSFDKINPYSSRMYSSVNREFNLSEREKELMHWASTQWGEMTRWASTWTRRKFYLWQDKAHSVNCWSLSVVERDDALSIIPVN
jgi:hypothetical protein